jgi:hypothetical protein
MTTTLEIDAETLRELNDIARREQKSVGEVISDLARSRPPDKVAKAADETTEDRPPEFKALPANGRVVTPDLIRQLQSEEFGE